MRIFVCMKIRLKIVTFVILLVISGLLKAQHPSESVIDKDEYRSNTMWSCSDKHFGYYFIDYSMPLPTVSGIENEYLSHSLKIGYTYRYRIAGFFDVGTELAYVNRTSRINNDSIPIFDPGTFYNRVKTYQNGFSASAYLRFTFAENTYRNLGYFMDLGAYYNRYLWYGTQYVLKNEDVYQKARFKKSNYIQTDGYGAFVRLSKSSFSLTFSYSLSDWINGFSNQNLAFERSPFLVGLQLNLYSK